MTTKEKIIALKSVAEFTIALHGFADYETMVPKTNQTRVWLESFKLARTERDIVNLYNLANDGHIRCREVDDFIWYITQLFDWT